MKNISAKSDDFILPLLYSLGVYIVRAFILTTHYNI